MSQSHRKTLTDAAAWAIGFEPTPDWDPINNQKQANILEDKLKIITEITKFEDASWVVARFRDVDIAAQVKLTNDPKADCRYAITQLAAILWFSAKEKGMV